MAGYTLAVSLCIIFAERYFAFFSSFQFQTTLRSFCKTKVLQQHSVGTADHGLSLYRAFSVTGHDGTSIFSKQIAVTSCAISVSEDTCCPLSLWCWPSLCGHSAWCRTSLVCLQHHATVVICNGVTVYGSQFPPTVSKHCQHQHNAILKIIPTIWNTTNPSCCDIQGADSSVQQHSSLCSQQQQSLLWCLIRPANIEQSCHTMYSSIHYVHLLLTPSDSCSKYPTVNSQQYLYSLSASPQGCDNIMHLSKKLRILNYGRLKCKLQILPRFYLEWFIERSIAITQIRKKWDNFIFFAKIVYWNWE